MADGRPCTYGTGNGTRCPDARQFALKDFTNKDPSTRATLSARIDGGRMGRLIVANRRFVLQNVTEFVDAFH